MFSVNYWQLAAAADSTGGLIQDLFAKSSSNGILGGRNIFLFSYLMKPESANSDPLR